MSAPRAAYRLVTPRLVLRCVCPEDAPSFEAAVEASRSHLEPWMPWARERLDLEGTMALLRKKRGEFDLDQDYFYGVFAPDDRTVLGSAGLHTRRGPDAREIGYWVHTAHACRGLATELAAALTKVAFEVSHVRFVEIRVAVENVASARVPQKLGFTEEGILRRRLTLGDGSFADGRLFSLFADAYPASPASRAEVLALDALGRRLL